MLDTMKSELILRMPELAGQVIESIYFGGGTPSVLVPSEIASFLTVINGNFEVLNTAEVTLEANPDDITEANCTAWHSLGFNRLSIGLQSFRENDLTWMNRSHSALEAEQCVSIAQAAGFSNISVDLIYGLPDLSLEEWDAHIERVLDMNIQHISAYCLTVEKKTALYKLVSSGQLTPGGDEAQSEQFIHLIDRLTTHGFHHYEISNFGLPTLEAVHNSNYWRGVNYLGIGPSAHSYNGIERRWNIANNAKYMADFGLNETWFESEVLTSKERWNELLMTGLRTSWGVNLQDLFQIASPTEVFKVNVKHFEAKNWLVKTDTHIILTREGRLMADYIASELFL